ncbi:MULTISPECIES: MucR family transcriptional regulator [unclassified Lentilitoribacter]|jgi:predicted transcriptional regulator|uniref:MucR family transcriptional regulator n=1 Tax=unclassified Lentilitoribacter TaxID=2647570 RepID=UPI0013A68F28|nr:MucR family transcriptional regulator [Lentilitoribacter sp. Alg239-R112]
MPENANFQRSSFMVKVTSEIVSSFVAKNEIDSSELPGLIKEVYGTIYDIVTQEDGTTSPQSRRPAVDAGESIQDDYLICLEDGKQFKSLKRHLMTHYNLTPEEYREKWGLPFDYPMVAPAYAKARSRLAKEMGLGQKR